MTIKELNNYESIKANYIACFDTLASTEIDALSRNDMAQIMAISYGSIKSALNTGKSNTDILTGAKTSKADISAYLKTLSADEIKELLK